MKLGETVRPTNGPSYSIHSVAIGVSRDANPRKKHFIAAELFYNQGYRALLTLSENEDLDNRFVNAGAVVLFFGTEYQLQHFTLASEVGVNVYNPGLKFWLNSTAEPSSMTSVKKVLAGKFGVNYYVVNPKRRSKVNAFIGLHVKSNAFQADFIQVATGVVLR